MRLFLLTLVTLVTVKPLCGQCKYLDLGTQNAIAAVGDHEIGPNKSNSSGVSFGFQASEIMELGVSMGFGKFKYLAQADDINLSTFTYQSVAPYIEFIGKKPSNPVSISFTIFYLGYMSSTESLSQKNMGVAASLFKEFSIRPSFTNRIKIIPEASVAKVVNFEGEKPGTSLSGMLNFLTNVHKDFELLLSGGVTRIKSKNSTNLAAGILLIIR